MGVTSSEILVSVPSAQRGGSDHRRRLLEGMAHAVAAKGYAGTTIADIVREAGVSRRTFYEHFFARSDCLIALYEAASHNALKVLEQAIDPANDWQLQLEDGIRGFLEHLSQNPVLLRTLFLEMPALGEPGLAARRRVHEALSGFLLDRINPRRSPRLLDTEMADAVVGAINEWILQAIESGRTQDLTLLAARAARLVRAVVAAGVH